MQFSTYSSQTCVRVLIMNITSYPSSKIKDQSGTPSPLLGNDNDQQRLTMVDCRLEERQDGVEKKEVTMVNGCVDLQEGAQPSYSLCSMQKWRSKIPGAGASTADHRRGET